MQRVAGGHFGRPQVAAEEGAAFARGGVGAGFGWLQGAAHAGQQQGLAGFVHHVGRVVAGAAVHAQAHGHTGVEHFAHGGDAAGQPHVAARAVGHAGFGGGKQADAFVVQLHAVGVPHVVAQPAQVLRVLRGGAVELFAAVGQVVVVFCQVGVQAGAVCAGQLGAQAHQVAADAEGAARGHGHVDHAAVFSAVVLLDQALGVFQDGIFVFHHVVGRQAACALAHAHAAARGHKAHANLLGGVDAVVQFHTVGVDVEVVAAGGAAAEQQLGHRGLGADKHHLGREPGPDGVQPAQPAKQLGILHLGDGAGQALVHVVVGVDQAGGDQVALGVQCFTPASGHGCGMLGGQGRGKLGGGAHPCDAVVADEQAGVAQLCAQARVGVVKRGDAGGVLNQQGGHGGGGLGLEWG